MEEYDVVIIGSGVAGLTAARHLVDVHGVSNLVIVEAADYVGGRVKQDHTFMKGKQVELGAEFLHGDTTPLMDLVAKHGLKVWWLCTWAQGDGGPLDKPASDGGCAYYYIGRENRLARFDELPAKLDSLHEALWDISDLDPEEVKGEAGQRSLNEYLRDVGVPEDMLTMADAGFSNTHGASSRDISLRNVHRFEAMYSHDGDVDGRMEPSYAPMIDVLKRGHEIRLNWRARHVQVSTTAAGQGVVVTSGDGEVIRAKAAIVTPSIAVLRDGDIAFTPPLLPHKVAALNRIHFGNAMKVLLKFKARPFPRDCHGIVCSDSFIPEMWMNMTTTPASPRVPGQPLPPQEYLVTGFAMDKVADAMQQLPHATIIARAVAQVDKMFSKDARQLSGATKHDEYASATSSFVEGAVHFWSDAPYIRGGYTSPHALEPTWARAAMEEPHAGRVFFAGEGCSGAVPEVGSPATVHGTMITGSRAANRVAGVLGSRGAGMSKL